MTANKIVAIPCSVIIPDNVRDTGHMKPRVLFRPRVVMSEQPEMVVTQTPLESPESFYETVLTPDEAFEYARQLLNDADRARRVRDTNKWLAKR